jgi:hypothetical protein
VIECSANPTDVIVSTCLSNKIANGRNSTMLQHQLTEFMAIIDCLHAHCSSVCVVEWVRPRASGFIRCELEGLSSLPGTDAVNQALHPYEVGKAVATSLL